MITGTKASEHGGIRTGMAREGNLARKSLSSVHLPAPAVGRYEEAPSFQQRAAQARAFHLPSYLSWLLRDFLETSPTMYDLIDQLQGQLSLAKGAKQAGGDVSWDDTGKVSLVTDGSERAESQVDGDELDGTGGGWVSQFFISLAKQTGAQWVTAAAAAVAAAAGAIYQTSATTPPGWRAKMDDRRHQHPNGSLGVSPLAMLAETGWSRTSFFPETGSKGESREIASRLSGFGKPGIAVSYGLDKYLEDADERTVKMLDWACTDDAWAGEGEERRRVCLADQVILDHSNRTQDSPSPDQTLELCRRQFPMMTPDQGKGLFVHAPRQDFEGGGV
ncbi:hypothetical protein OPQ81_000080 [Rhizoctonia solani]|nr:hypothetical protein OPQ81_000080 [Rhizoctonia solani]